MGLSSATRPGERGTCFASSIASSEARAFEHVQAAERLLRLEERPVGHDRVTFALESKRPGLLRPLQRLTEHDRVSLTQHRAEAAVVLDHGRATVRPDGRLSRRIAVEQEKVFHGVLEMRSACTPMMTNERAPDRPAPARIRS